MFRARIFPEGDFTYSWESPLFPGSCPPKMHPLFYTLTSLQAQSFRAPLPTKSYFFLFYPVFLFPTLSNRKPALSSVTVSSELFSKWQSPPLLAQTTEAGLLPSHYLGMSLMLLYPTNYNTYISSAPGRSLKPLFLDWSKIEAISTLEKRAPVIIYICVHCKMLQMTNN